jgi:hypothetical protein
MADTSDFKARGYAVTYRLEDDVEYEPEAAPRRSHWISVIVFLGLAARRRGNEAIGCQPWLDA